MYSYVKILKSQSQSQIVTRLLGNVKVKMSKVGWRAKYGTMRQALIHGLSGQLSGLSKGAKDSCHMAAQKVEEAAAGAVQEPPA